MHDFVVTARHAVFFDLPALRRLLADVVIVDGGMTLRPGTPVEAKPLNDKKNSSPEPQDQVKKEG